MDANNVTCDRSCDDNFSNKDFRFSTTILLKITPIQNQRIIFLKFPYYLCKRRYLWIERYTFKSLKYYWMLNFFFNHVTGNYYIEHFLKTFLIKRKILLIRITYVFISTGKIFCNILIQNSN